MDPDKVVAITCMIIPSLIVLVVGILAAARNK